MWQPPNATIVSAHPSPNAHCGRSPLALVVGVTPLQTPLCKLTFSQQSLGAAVLKTAARFDAGQFVNCKLVLLYSLYSFSSELT